VQGVVIPDIGQMPLIDSHARHSVDNVLGHVKHFETKSHAVNAEIFFSETEEGKRAAQKVKEGSITDVSIGYKNSESFFVPEGETEDFNGRSFKGPVKVVTNFSIHELSLTPIGADENAKIRSKEKGVFKMPDEKAREKAVKEERDRVVEINAMCSRFDCVALGNQLIAEGATISGARKEVMKDIERNRDDDADNLGHRTPIEVGYEGVEKRRAAAIDGLTLRAGINLDHPAPGANEYRVLSLVDIARETLVGAGIKTRGLSASRIIRTALQSRAASMSDFPSLLAGTANKVLRESYDMSPGTYELWCNVTENPDYKEMSRNQLSEAPDLDEIPEHTPYKYGKFTDAKEVFQIASYGKLFGITRHALINDDLAAFTRIPMAFAQSAKRKVNTAAYAALTANAAMADGVALFHADHSNYVGSGSGAAPAIATLDTARTAMRTQTGLQGAILNIAPRFIIIPAALETATDTVLNSAGDLDDYKSSAVKNPFFGKLEPVVEAGLDANSTKTWYLASDKNACDTVEVCFLSGSGNGPYLETKEGWTVDGIEYKVRIEFGVKAIDYRGLYSNYGE